MRRKPCLLEIAGVAATLLYSLALAQDPFVAEAKRYTDRVSNPNPPWDGPSTGSNATEFTTEHRGVYALPC
jgi:hypothetical protein